MKSDQQYSPPNAASHLISPMRSNSNGLELKTRPSLSSSAGNHDSPPSRTSIGLAPLSNVASFDTDLPDRDGLVIVRDNDDAVHDDGDANRTATTSAWQSYVHLIKGNIGPGCLSLPWAVSQLGVPFGVVCCFVVCGWSSYNSWTLVQLQRQTTVHTYPQVAGHYGGATLQRITTICICTQQLSICTVFVSFFGTNLRATLVLAFANAPLLTSHATVMTLALPAVLALSVLPHLKSMAPVTQVATALFMLGLALLGVVMVLEWNNTISYHAASSQHHRGVEMILAICALLYSYEGICLVLPVQSSMKAPQHFGMVFAVALSTAATINACVGGLSVHVFGDIASGSITAHLLNVYGASGGGGGGATATRALLLLSNALVSISVLITFPLQLFPAVELIVPLCANEKRTGGVGGGGTAITPHDRFASLSTQDNDDNDDHDDREGTDATNDGLLYAPYNDDDHWKIRAACALLCYVLAVAVPNVQSLISLSGALAGSSTALWIPPFLEILCLRQCPDGRTCHAAWLRAWCLLVLGVVFLLVGTMASVRDIVHSYIT